MGLLCKGVHLGGKQLPSLGRMVVVGMVEGMEVVGKVVASSTCFGV